jgi:hypothetical protein
MCSKPCTAVAFRRGCSCHARAALVRQKVASSTRPILIIILLPVPIIGGIIPVQTETYEHTISGLLGKRTDLF